ncbi:MAG: hypothetical protein HFE79_14000, partial [Ruminiclostridium sp.]|nr:hypothetical protein [Ruminiclostridium sp.]
SFSPTLPPVLCTPCRNFLFASFFDTVLLLALYFFVKIVSSFIIQHQDVLNYVSNLIHIGKIIFIRADSYTANESIIRHILGYKDCEIGKIYDNPYSLVNRINTLGHMVYLDAHQNLQVVRQTIEYVSPTEKITKNDINEINNMEEQIVVKNDADELWLNYSIERPIIDFNTQIQFVSDFLTYNSPTDMHIFNSAELDIKPQSFDVGSNYEKIYDTKIYLDENSNRIGSITKRICAARLDPVTNVKTGTPSPVATGNTKWAFQSVINMSPNRDKDFLNAYLYTSFTTYPIKSTNLTYKNIIADYQPKVDISGATEVTHSIGATSSIGTTQSSAGINGGVTWKKSYKDINFDIDYKSGASTETNIARWNYKIGNGDYDTNFGVCDVQKNTIELVSAVRINNDGNTKVGVQLNTAPTWMRSDTLFTHLTYRCNVESVVYMLPVR